MDLDIRCQESYKIATSISEKICRLLNSPECEIPKNLLLNLMSGLEQLDSASRKLIEEESSSFACVKEAFEKIAENNGKNEEQVREACMLLLENVVERLVLLEQNRINPMVETVMMASKILSITSQSCTFHEVHSTMKSFLVEWCDFMGDLESFLNTLIDVGHVKTIRCLLVCMYFCAKYIVENIAETAIYPLSKHTKHSRAFLVKTLQNLLHDLARFLENPNEATPSLEATVVDNGVPNFVTYLDKLLDRLAKTVGVDDLPVLEEWTNEVVKHAEKVAVAVGEDGGKVIISFIDRALTEFRSLQNLLVTNGTANTESGMTCDYVADFLELLEQQVNVALLNLVLDAFSRIHEPIESALKNDSPSRILTTAEKVQKVAELTSAATSDERSVLQIRATAWLIKKIAQELTALLEKDRKDECRTVCLLRLWKNEVKKFVNEVEGLIDPCAFAQVVERVARKNGEKVKQIVVEGQSEGVVHLVDMITSDAEYLIGFLEKQNVLEEDVLKELPIREMKSTIREVKAASAAVTSNGTQKQLNSLLKRVEILVTMLEKIVDSLSKFSDAERSVTESSEKSSDTPVQSFSRSRRKSLRSHSNHAISFARSLQKFPEDVRLLPIDINTPGPAPAPLRRCVSSLPTTPKILSPRQLKSTSIAELSRHLEAQNGCRGGTFIVEKSLSIQLNFTEILEDLTKVQNNFTGEHYPTDI